MSDVPFYGSLFVKPRIQFSFWGTMAVPGDTELGSAGEQPNKG